MLPDRNLSGVAAGDGQAVYWHGGGLERQLRTGGQMFEAAFQAAAIGKAIVAVTGHCIEVNPALATLLGYAPDDLRGMHFADFTHPEDIAVDLHLFDAVMRGERDSYQLEKRYLHHDGTILHVLLSVTVVREEDGSPIQFVSEVVDLSEQRRVGLELEAANARLRQQVITDHLTGLYNRRGFEEALTAAPDGSLSSMLLIDLDNFKAVNDRLGHEAGDLVLAEVGSRLSAIARTGDFVARVGGDEFGIILHDASCDMAGDTATRIVTALGRAFEVNGDPVQIGASVGASSATQPSTTLRHLMTRADDALYAAKRAGRGTWRLAA